MRTQKLSAFAIAAVMICLVSPTHAHPDALRVNNICELNDCTNVPLTPTNTSSSTPFNFTYQFANSDLFRIQGTIYAAQSTSGSGYYDEVGPSDFIITYLGNGSNTVSGSDVLSTEFLGRYPAVSAGAGYYNSELRGTFGPGLGLASSAAAYFTIDNRLVSTIGPVSPPPGTFDILDSGTFNVRAGVQTLDYNYVLSFGSGSAPGSSIELYPTVPVSPTPEPSSFVLLGTGLVSLATVLRRRLSNA